MWTRWSSEPGDLVMWTRWSPGRWCEPGWSLRGGRRSASRPEHGLCSPFLFRNKLHQHFSGKSKHLVPLFAATLCAKYFLYLHFAWHWHWPDTVQRRRCFRNSESSSGHCVNTSDRAQYRILQPRWVSTKSDKTFLKIWWNIFQSYMKYSKKSDDKKIRGEIQAKSPVWSSYTAKDPRRDRRRGIHVLW